MPVLIHAWKSLQMVALLRPIQNETDFKRIHALADELADEVGDDNNHPLFSLFEITMSLIERWEDENVSIPELAPKEILRFLLEQNNLKQKDLIDIASPTLISDILAGRRDISKSLARNLSKRFHIDISAFM